MGLFEGFDRKLVTAGDMTINCAVAGSGPPLLLLHGYPQNMTMWARVAPMLAETFTVVCADLRGYGDSSKPRNAPDNSTYSFRAMAGDQVGLMRALGFERFHLVGHDRGARTAHRMALDHPDAVRSLAVLDIAPTYSMFMKTNRFIGRNYWHWYFLSQPEPFPEHMIGLDPDFFYETSLVGWGRSRIEDFAPDMLADYRRCWRDPAMIHGSCSDYRAAATIDLEHDEGDAGRKVPMPALAFWGADGVVAKNFDTRAEWAERCERLETATLPGGHFFIDRFPAETAKILSDFLSGAA